MSEEKKAPEVIWLQDEGDENHPTAGEWYEGATWCEEAMNDGDVKYIRADIHESALAESRQLTLIWNARIEIDTLRTQLAQAQNDSFERAYIMLKDVAERLQHPAYDDAALRVRKLKSTQQRGR